MFASFRKARTSQQKFVIFERGNDGPTPGSDGPRRRGAGRHPPNTHRRGGGQVLREGPQGRALGVQGTTAVSQRAAGGEGAHKTCPLFCFVAVFGGGLVT